MVKECMTRGEAQSLESGQVLIWIGKGEECSGTGTTAYRFFRPIYGESVSFLEHVGRNDQEGMPIIKVETIIGACEFSSGWLKKVPHSQRIG